MQLLDGIGAGIFGVVSVLVVADLTKGTGRFNLTQGALATATGVGAGLSNLLAGFVVKAAGFDAGFLTLAAIAAAAALFFALAMPETLQTDRPALGDRIRQCGGRGVLKRSRVTSERALQFCLMASQTRPDVEAESLFSPLRPCSRAHPALRQKLEAARGPRRSNETYLHHRLPRLP